MTGFLASFSKPFQLAVLLWPFVSVLLTVPAAVYLYHRDNRLRPASVLGVYAFMLYVLGLGCFTMYPWPQDPTAYCATHHLGAQLNPLQFIVDIRTEGMTAILQLGMNIVLFVPMGFFLTRFSRLPSWVAVAVCCATSICIEVAQLTGIFHLYPCAYRICDVDDVITNTLGGAIGIVLGLWCNRAFPAPLIDKAEVTVHPGFLRRCVSLAVDMGIIYMCQMLSIVLWSYLGHGAVAPDGHAFLVLLSVWFVVFEGIVPWCTHGRTIGCFLTRMTVESGQRTMPQRLAFYVARTALLYTLTIGVYTWRSPWTFVLGLATVVWWIACKQMPYDAIGEDRSRMGGTGWGHQSS